MIFFDTKHKRKSIKTTAVVLILLLLLMYNMGMEYSDPPIEYGVTISAGDIGYSEPVTNTVPSNNNNNNNKVKENVVREEESQEQIIEPKEVSESVKTPLAENYVEDQTSDKVATIKKVEKKEEVTIKQPTDLKKKNSEIKEKLIQKTFEVPKETKIVQEKAIVETKEETKPRDFNQANKALSNLLSSNTGASKSDSQDDNRETANSKTDGIRSAGDAKYSGKGSGNYQLSGRKALIKAKQKPDCESEGIVVVHVVVNNQGKVVQARGIGIECLRKAAESAAKKTRWNADSKAPKNQKGKIIYRFTLN